MRGRKPKTNAEFLLEIADRPFLALDTYIGRQTKIRFKCKVDGNIWSTSPSVVLKGHGCPICGDISGSKKRIQSNTVLENRGAWLLIDISTPAYPNAAMAVDSSVWENHDGGRVFAVKSSTGKYIYATYRKSKNCYFFHNDVLPTAEGFEVDHSTHGNLEFIDNRLTNLRAVTRSQNVMNRSLLSNNKSGFAGVWWAKDRERWLAYASIGGKFTHLGYYTSKEEAVRVRRQAVQEHYGEHAYDPSYLKHIVTGRKRLTETAALNIKPVLDEMFKKYPIDTQGE